MTNVDDVQLIILKTFVELNGNLVPIEGNKDIPFDIERIFYVYGVNDQHTRGKHAHYETSQLLICLNGVIQVTCKDESKSRNWTLDIPNKGLYIPSMIWDEQTYMTSDSTLLVLSSTQYDSEDYINDWNKFLEERR